MKPDEVFQMRDDALKWGDVAFEGLTSVRHLQVLTKGTPILVRADTKKAAIEASAGMLGEPIAIDDWLVDDPEDVGAVGGYFVFEEPLKLPLDESWVRNADSPRDSHAMISLLSWASTILTDQTWLDVLVGDEEAFVYDEEGNRTGVRAVLVAGFGYIEAPDGTRSTFPSTGVSIGGAYGGIIPAGLPLTPFRIEGTNYDEVWGAAVAHIKATGVWPTMPADASVAALLGTLSAFLHAEVMVSTPLEMTRPERRRSERSVGHSRFNVIEFPRRIRTGTAEPGEGGCDWSHRWWVRPHWRTLHRGTPDQRRVRVKGYVKGPDGLPFEAKDILGRV